MKLISPAGEIVEVYRVNSFCRDNGLDNGCLYKVHGGERRHHKGWRSAEVPQESFPHKPHGIERWLES
jgi:hypothetical protein